MPKKSLPAPFQARPAIVLDGAAARTTVTAPSTPRDPYAGLPAQGPREIAVRVVGGRVLLSPSDREAALDLDTARSALGARYDHKRRAWTFALDTMLRHGVVDWASVRLAAELAGLRLRITPGVETAIARYLRHIARQTRPIPRVTWLDDQAEESEELGSQRLDSTGWRR